MPLEDDIVWVEVVLKEKHEVFIHKGKKIIRRMPASGGRPDQPTLLGTFYIQDRGPNFFSERFNEGATYWVRFLDQYLFHGIPRDKRWNIIDSELRKIGKPASHGCIRFLEEDAKWFYENIPQGTMVIIHE
ncbi:MAG: L,D-transpeptidase [Epulopiscium sp.]|nr:L,D-transpeptidase [Candidatus Epulonipiscium sp.]